MAMRQATDKATPIDLDELSDKERAVWKQIAEKARKSKRGELPTQEL